MLRAVAKQHADAGNAWQAASIVAAVDALASQALAIDLEQGLRDLYRAYVRLLESGRDRITSLGGDCDPVDVMERSDIDLRKVRDLLALIDGQAAGLVRACERDQSPAPPRIWLQIDIYGNPAGPMPQEWDELDEVCWCRHSLGGLEVEYVRADLAHVQPNKGKGVPA